MKAIYGFMHTILQGWANLFNRRVIDRKPKAPVSYKISLLSNTVY